MTADDDVPEVLWEFHRAHQLGGPERARLEDGGATVDGRRWLDLSMWSDDDGGWVTVSLDPEAAEDLEVAFREFRERR